MDVRIEERRERVQRARRRRRLRRTAYVVIGVLVVAGLVLLERSGLVALAEVRVTGTARLSAATVRDAAALPLGTSTLRLPLGEAEERVEALPLVADARARRVDPLTVEIQVEERTPVLMARGHGDAVLIDRDGVVMATGEEPDLPVVDLGSHPAPTPGERVTALTALANAHAVWRGLPGPLRADVHRYRARGRDALLLVLQDGTEVMFGRAHRLDEKARALSAVLEDLGDTSAGRIDVRAPGAPVVVG